MRISSLIQGVLCHLVCELATVPGQTYFLRLAYVLEKIHVINQKWVRHEGIKSSFLKGVSFSSIEDE